MSAATLMTPTRGELMPSNSDIENEFGRPPAAAAVEISSSRAMQEVRAQFAIAKQFPRNESEVFANVMRACERRKLAEVAEYEYKRGTTVITGPTIRLMEVIAQQWGNIDSGFMEVDQRKGWSTVQCFAVDLQTGARSTKTFQVEHIRATKSGKYAVTDPRDIYELVANQAMRRVRACIQAVIPGDLIESAVNRCRKTLSSNEKPLQERVQSMIEAFAEYQVTVPMLEAVIQMPLRSISETQFARLRRMYASLKDGVSSREELFDVTAGSAKTTNGDGHAADGAPASKSGAVAEKLKGNKAPTVDAEGEIVDPPAAGSLADFNEPDKPNAYGNGKRGK